MLKRTFIITQIGISRESAFNSNMAAKTTTCLYLVKRLIGKLKFAVNTITTFEDKVQNLRSLHRYDLTCVKKIIEVLKIKSVLLCLKYAP